MAIAGATMAVPGQAAVQSTARLAPSPSSQQAVQPNAVNNLDCNGYSTKYKALRSGSKMECTDPVLRGEDDTYRFQDNGHYIGHDEPSVKFISHVPGTGNTMNYQLKLPVDPSKKPTANGSVDTYAELSVAPWFGLPMCVQLRLPEPGLRGAGQLRVPAAQRRSHRTAEPAARRCLH
jgi:hypothetical protein